MPQNSTASRGDSRSRRRLNEVSKLTSALAIAGCIASSVGLLLSLDYDAVNRFLRTSGIHVSLNFMENPEKLRLLVKKGYLGAFAFYCVSELTKYMKNNPNIGTDMRNEITRNIQKLKRFIARNFRQEPTLPTTNRQITR